MLQPVKNSNICWLLYARCGLCSSIGCNRNLEVNTTKDMWRHENMTYHTVTWCNTHDVMTMWVITFLWPIQYIRKVFRPLVLLHILLRYSLILNWGKLIQTLCYETRNWAQVHPVSIDHPWDVSTTWLESTCGTFHWLDMIWKGPHTCLCKVPQLTVHVRAKTKPWTRRNCP